LKINSLIDKTSFTKDEIFYLLNLNENSDQNLLFNRARQREQEYCDSPINSYGLIEISTYCSENCNYCRLRRDNTSIFRERMNRESIIEVAKEINKSGIKSIVIRSGCDDFYDEDKIAYIIYSIKKHADVDIMLGLGQRTIEEYKEWKIAGASGYRLRFKSSNPQIYKSLNCLGTFENRLEHIEHLKTLGYQVCSGSIIGLPNQSFEDIAKDIQLCKNLELDIAEFLSFSKQSNTPLQNFNSWSEEKIQKTIAVARLILNDRMRNSKPNYVFNLEAQSIN